MAEQIEKSETTKVDETRAEGASDVAPEDKREVVDPMDTADFFREVDEANDAADGDDMVDMIDDAIALLESMTKPPQRYTLLPESQVWLRSIECFQASLWI